MLQNGKLVSPYMLIGSEVLLKQLGFGLAEQYSSEYVMWPIPADIAESVN
jgi:hypothetical protein